METLSLQSIVEVAPSVLATQMGEETILLNTRTGTYFGLNSVGQQILELIREPRTVREVAERLSHTYSVGLRQLEEDAVTFVESLIRHEIVRVLD